MTHSGIMKPLRGVRHKLGPRPRAGGKRRVEGLEWGGSVRGVCKVTPHQGTIFTTCLFNTRPNYSRRIFSQPLWHTVAPSQTQASDGTGGFTLRCAAKGNTPYPLAFSCAHLAPFQLPSTLHTRTFRTFPPRRSKSFQAFSFSFFSPPSFLLICHMPVFSSDKKKEGSSFKPASVMA